MSVLICSAILFGQGLQAISEFRVSQTERVSMATTPVQVIVEVMDGLEAVRQAQELRPDLILLDIGLPSLNGIAAARQIHKLSPDSKILFISQEMSADFVQEALGTGASGYIVKIDAISELNLALEAILRGEKFVSTRLRDHISTKA